MPSGRSSLVLIFLLTWSALRADVASAQDPADARAYWHALARATSVADAAAVPRGNSLRIGVGALIADGLQQLRQYELTGSQIEAAKGRQLLEHLVEQNGKSAWAQFALGASLARGPDLRIRAANGSYFVDAHSLAAKHAPRALQRALQLDPTLQEAALELGTLALDVNDGKLLVAAERALASPRMRPQADAWLLRARIAERLNAPQRAVAIIDSAGAHGIDVSVAAHERARSLFRVPGYGAEAMASYYDGIAQLTPDGAETYFRALEPILSADDVAEWRELELSQRRAWLRRYWDVAAGLSGVSAEERIAAHYQRLYEARMRFPLVRALGAGSGAADVVDPRSFGTTATGLLHVRHGDAARVQRIGRCGPGVDTIPPLLRPPIASCRTLQRSGAGLPAWQAELAAAEQRIRERQAREYAFEGESYYPAYRRDLPIAWELYQFRGAAGRTEIVAAIAAPAAPLNPLEPQGPFLAQVGLIAVDTAADRVYRNEHVQARQRATAAGDLIWTASLDIIPVRALQLRVRVADDRMEAGRISRGQIDVRSFGADALSVSDLVIAPNAGSATLYRGEVALSLAPRRDYARAERFDLYYEIYGLAMDAAYRTELVIAPNVSGIWERLQSLAGRLPDVLRLEFNDVAGAPDTRYGTQVMRSVDASALSAGDYRLRVTTIETSTGRRAVVERVVTIR